MTRRLVRVVVVCCLVALTVFAAPALARAQSGSVTPVVGTADFRDPPLLPDGVYEDTIVTGETVWYAVMYRNESPYQFEVSLPNLADSAAGITPVVQLIAPDLEPASAASSFLQSDGVSHRGAETHLWYLQVSLNSGDVTGTAHRVRLEVDGVESTRLGDCADLADCDADVQLAQLVNDLAIAERDLEEFGNREAAKTVELEIANLQSFIETAEAVKPQHEARLAAAETRLTRLCAPGPICDTPDRGTGTPPWAMAFGMLALGGGAIVAVNKWRNATPTVQDPIA